MDNIVYKYFTLTENQKRKIDSMKSIYAKWNDKVNLISRKDFDNFYEKHVLHSLSICKIISFKSGTKIMDLGTGGGFPGVPLAIMHPNVNFHLVDSISKKTKVLSSIVQELDLSNVIVLNKRAEDIDDSFDFIVTRAVAKLDQLSLWSKNKISSQSNNSIKNGLICLKGGDLSSELAKFNHSVSKYLISDFFKEEFFLNKKIIHFFN
ncbi:MAG: 16S rRNA (guanine(527)-N(7))-methyltransferase RsmG [Flavobacteriales bacterium TMED191]|nr:MAG: 16S rRNA (guanine(527)-N(7))-methyltransferase RsmG [Flavobacteriales bacterium TMED191]